MQKITKSTNSSTSPWIFCTNDPSRRDSFDHFKAENDPLLLDDLDSQLKDLMQCLYPSGILSGTPPENFIAEWLNNQPLENFYNWVYFPWKNTAVKLLTDNEFVTCRTNRNKLKITEKEQAELSKKTVLFIGLSVGQSVAYTIARQRICSHLILADFDTLSVSNLNRVSASVCDLGLPKTTIAARAIAEMDPYLKVSIVEEGITEENLEKLCSEQHIDLIVEECDNFPIKILVREIARKHGIPVVMETNDKCILDVERFDLDPAYPILHGLLKGLSYNDIKKFSPKERMELILQIFDRANFSEGMERSWNKIGTEIISWPQLAHEVTIGGGVVAMTVMLILLKRGVKSGRYGFEPEKLLNI